jgi:hypothetical protein
MVMAGLSASGRPADRGRQLRAGQSTDFRLSY